MSGTKPPLPLLFVIRTTKRFLPALSKSAGILYLRSVYNEPVTNYTVKGFLWYQGESNITRAAEYAQLQQSQINDWRKKWNIGNVPFLLVQMPNYQDYTYTPVESSWALFRESQAKALALPNVGMAITIDIGEWNDIHP